MPSPRSRRARIRASSLLRMRKGAAFILRGRRRNSLRLESLCSPTPRRRVGFGPNIVDPQLSTPVALRQSAQPARESVHTGGRPASHSSSTRACSDLGMLPRASQSICQSLFFVPSTRALGPPQTLGFRGGRRLVLYVCMRMHIICVSDACACACACTCALCMCCIYVVRHDVGGRALHK